MQTINNHMINTLMDFESTINLSEMLPTLFGVQEMISNHPFVQEHKPDEENVRKRKTCIGDECRLATIDRLRYSDNKFGETLKVAFNSWFVA